MSHPSPGNRLQENHAECEPIVLSICEKNKKINNSGEKQSINLVFTKILVLFLIQIKTLRTKKIPPERDFSGFCSITDWLFVRFKRGAQDIAQRRP
jgi:hypothetical protein